LRLFINSFWVLDFGAKKIIILKKELLCVLQSDLEVQLERMINEKKECEQNLERSVGWNIVYFQR